MRLRAINLPVIARVTGCVAVAAIIAGAALRFRLVGTGNDVSAHVSAPQNDPLAAELSHCQAIGMAAKDGKACNSVWAKNRQRFFIFQPTTYPEVNRPYDEKPQLRPEGQ